MLVTHSFWFCHCFDLEPLLIWNVLWIKIKHLPHARQWMQMLVGMCACRVFSIYSIRGDCWIHHQYCIRNLPIYIRQITSHYSLEKISRCRCYYRSNESHNHTHEFTYKCDKTKYVLKKCLKKTYRQRKENKIPISPVYYTQWSAHSCGISWALKINKMFDVDSIPNVDMNKCDQLSFESYLVYIRFGEKRIFDDVSHALFPVHTDRLHMKLCLIWSIRLSMNRKPKGNLVVNYNIVWDMMAVEMIPNKRKNEISKFGNLHAIIWLGILFFPLFSPLLDIK